MKYFNVQWPKLVNDIVDVPWRLENGMDDSTDFATFEMNDFDTVFDQEYPFAEFGNEALSETEEWTESSCDCSSASSVEVKVPDVSEKKEKQDLVPSDGNFACFSRKIRNSGNNRTIAGAASKLDTRILSTHRNRRKQSSRSRQPGSRLRRNALRKPLDCGDKYDSWQKFGPNVFESTKPKKFTESKSRSTDSSIRPPFTTPKRTLSRPVRTFSQSSLQPLSLLNDLRNMIEEKRSNDHNKEPQKNIPVPLKHTLSSRLRALANTQRQRRVVRRTSIQRNASVCADFKRPRSESESLFRFRKPGQEYSLGSKPSSILCW